MEREYERLFAGLPAPGPGCVISVAIPVCDEAESITACLAAFASQYTLCGRSFNPTRFEVLVFANNCRDATPDIIRRFCAIHPELSIVLIDTAVLGQHHGNVAIARRAVMNASAARMLDRGGIVATSDGDTVVDSRWLAAIESELAQSHAVGGRIIPLADPGRRDIGALDPVLQFEHRYRYAIVRLESLIDPVTYDPWPRHGNHQGASLAVRARSYHDVGGIPICESLEDFGLYRALLRNDVPFRHSLNVRARTSARYSSRVANGFAADLRAIGAHIRGERTVEVEHASYWRTLFRGRAALRQGNFRETARLWDIAESRLRRAYLAATHFGALSEAAEHWAHIEGKLSRYPRIPADAALALLENYGSLTEANIAEPTRNIA